MTQTSVLMFILVVTLLCQVHSVIAEAAWGIYRLQKLVTYPILTSTLDEVLIKSDTTNKRNNVAAYDERDADVPLLAKGEAVNKRFDLSAQDVHDVHVPREPKKHPKPPSGPPPPPDPPHPKVTPCYDFLRFGKRVQCPGSEATTDETRGVNVPREPKKHPKPLSGPRAPPPPPDPPRPRVTPCADLRFGKRVQCPGPKTAEINAVNEGGYLPSDGTGDVNVP
ncbi:MAG: hypothetical protein Q9160_009095, partial [Pyrenula sp. 1 TL-2023]